MNGACSHNNTRERAKRFAASGPDRSDLTLIDLVRLLAQQAARETLEADPSCPGGKEDNEA